jgi:hypothetical protein
MRAELVGFGHGRLSDPFSGLPNDGVGEALQLLRERRQGPLCAFGVIQDDTMPFLPLVPTPRLHAHSKVPRLVMNDAAHFSRTSANTARATPHTPS